MRAAINCALANRQIITHLARQAFQATFPKADLPLLYDVSHNTCKLEEHAVDGKPMRLFVHRKGATRAFGPGHPALPDGLKASGQPVLIGGSMGSVVGEIVTRSIETATERNLPLVIVSCSGGARMQESALSLVQMAKTSAALARLDRAGGLFISVLTDPTTGGVTASFAMLGDVILAEPGALIGFAGPRVIQQTIRQELPEGFQRAEFLLSCGLIDRVVPRHNLRSEIARVIDYAGK